MKLRIATPDDAKKLQKLYAWYVIHSAATFEWDVPDVDEFRRRIESTLKDYPYIVVEEDGEIMGYAYVSPFKGRKAYEWSAETSIYIAHESRQKGYGSLLYKALEKIMPLQNVCNLYACIARPTREDDPHLSMASICFHQLLGYRLCAEFEGCAVKYDTWYDMVWMGKRIATLEEHPKPFLPFLSLNRGEVEKILERLCDQYEEKREEHR